MEKITNFKGINKYFCSICNSFHRKTIRKVVDIFGNTLTVKDSKFYNHKNYGYKMSESELRNYQFKKNWKSYSIKSHKKTKGSKA